MLKAGKSNTKVIRRQTMPCATGEIYDVATPYSLHHPYKMATSTAVVDASYRLRQGASFLTSNRPRHANIFDGYRPNSVTSTGAAADDRHLSRHGNAESCK